MTDLRSEAFDRLFERRVVFLRGPLDDDTATDVAAQLLALDGSSSDAVTLLVNSPGGPLGSGLSVVDVLGSLQAPVDTTCIGQAMGTAAAVVALGTGRRMAGPRSRLSLRLGAEERLDGTASDVGRAVEWWRRQRDQLVTALAVPTGVAGDVLRAQFDDGPVLDPPAAIALGLLDPGDPLRA